MDVTSLLNSNPAAAEQRKRADSSSSRAPSRNRTPWDAGGYSLPINTAAHGVKAPQQQDQQENRHNDLHISTPPSSPKHRFSDSRSSLSSFASSLQSTTTHSRYSSTSTLNSSFHAHHKSHGTEILSPELRSISQALEESASVPLAIDSYNATESRQDTSLSPTDSTLEQLAFVAESHSSEPRSESSRRNHSDVMETTAANLAESAAKSNSLNRPGSPSDAILIKRTSVPSLRVNTGGLNEYQRQINYLSAPLDRYRPSILQNKTHKRTLSAPNFRPSTTSSLVFKNTLPHQPNTFFTPTYEHQPSDYFGMEKSPRVPDRGADDISPSSSKMDNNDAPYVNVNVDPLTSTADMDGSTSASGVATMSVHHHGIGPHAEPTPPLSQHPDQASPTSPPTYATPNTPPTLAPVAETTTIVCMYILNCDTGSQLRKAISHIFGRNKMCTRQIPDHVWVHYCRKHYQRARYRNPKEYAKLQCDLVQEQLANIHNWSEGNRKNNNRSGVVLYWTLAIRKREQKRQEDKERRKNTKRKRSDANAEDDDEEEDDLGHEPATAVPEWLREKCRGQRYTMQQVCEIFNRLHREILNETGSSSFPDLEILPNISVNTERPKTPNGYTKRSSSITAHRRSQSMGVVSSSQQSVWGDEPSMHDPPMQKRRRPNSRGNEEYFERDLRELPPQHMSRPRMARPMEGRRLPHCSMYPHPEELHGYGTPQRGDYYPNSPTGFQVPLPAPTPQRSMYYSTASYFEQGPEPRRPTHGRSQSDIGFMHGQPGYMQQPPYHHDPRSLAPSHYQGMGYPPLRDQTYSPSAARLHMDDPNSSHPRLSDIRAPQPYAPGHGRHQSTPMMQPTYGSPSQTYQRLPQSHAPPPRRSPLPPAPRVKEGEKTQQLFRDRH